MVTIIKFKKKKLVSFTYQVSSFTFFNQIWFSSERRSFALSFLVYLGLFCQAIFAKALIKVESEIRTKVRAQTEKEAEKRKVILTAKKRNKKLLSSFS